MSRFYDSIDFKLREFIEEQNMFIVATAPEEGRVNTSPKGMNTFRVLSENRVIYLDLTGSGNETASHVMQNGRITFMFMSFGRKPMILRLYGMATVVQPSDSAWDELVGHFDDIPGTRQIFDAEISSVQTSCGFGIPEYEMKKERTTLAKWSSAKGADGMADYWEEKNLESIDGLPTGLSFEGRGLDR